MTAKEIKLVFAGPTGVGKTTAIAAISDQAPVSTDVATTDDLALIKATTTVALDYSSLKLEDGTLLSLYGAPGQQRFDFMWQILAQGALGLIVLVDGSSSDAGEELRICLRGFATLVQAGAVVVGINKVDLEQDLAPYEAILESHQVVAPIVNVDVRQSEDVRMLVDLLLTTLEFG